MKVGELRDLLAAYDREAEIQIDLAGTLLEVIDVVAESDEVIIEVD